MLPRTPPSASGLLRPEDLECVSTAFELTLRYLNENVSHFDVPSARNFAAEVIMSRAMEGEHDAYRLWADAVQQLKARDAGQDQSGNSP